MSEYHIPEHARGNIKHVIDNRRPGQQVAIDPVEIIEFFKEPLKKWLDEKAREQAKQRR